MRRGTDIRAMVAVVLLVWLVLVGGAIWDSFALRARETACERVGMAFVSGVAGFECVAKLSGERS